MVTSNISYTVMVGHSHRMILSFSSIPIGTHQILNSGAAVSFCYTIIYFTYI